MLRRTTPAAAASQLFASSSLLLASAIPRHVWDPQRHDPKWVDSLAKPVSDRRAWSAKKYSIGLEPLTPSEWLHYSKRNLAYEYNAAMRACDTFPDLLPIYSEMKQRGVKLDVDTMYVVLGRAARYEKMEPQDAFLLFDEMVELGAKPDIAVVEILHTLWDLSGHCDATWRELKRRELIRWYHRLCARDLAAFGQTGYDKLLLTQIKRYRTNLKSLGSVMHAQLWSAVFAHIRDPADLLAEFAHMLWERAPADCKFAEIPSLDGSTVTIPVLGESLRRRIVHNQNQQQQNSGQEEDISFSSENSNDNNADSQNPQIKTRGNESTSTSDSSNTNNQSWSIENDAEANPTSSPGDLSWLSDVLNTSSNKTTEINASVWRRVSASSNPVASFEDFGLNRALLSALERVVDEPFPLPIENPLRARSTPDEGFLTLALVGAAQRSGMFFSADVLSQALDTTRFTEELKRRERNSIRYLGFALNVTSIANRNAALDKAIRAWKQNRCSMDDRVVARYIQCRDPWSDVVFCPSRGKHGAFSLLLTQGSASSSSTKPDEAQPGQLEGSSDSSSAPAPSVDLQENKTASSSESLVATETTNNNNQNNNSASSIALERWNNLFELVDRFSLWNKMMREGKNHPDNNLLSADAADGVVEVMTATTGFLLRLTDALSPINRGVSSSASSKQQIQTTNVHRLFRSPEQQIRALVDVHRMLAQVKRDIDVTCANVRIVHDVSSPPALTNEADQQFITPSVECWESMLVVCKVAMDRLANLRVTDLSIQKQADDIFKQYAALRSQLIHEAKERHGGQLKMLWLQEI